MFHRNIISQLASMCTAVDAGANTDDHNECYRVVHFKETNEMKSTLVEITMTLDWESSMVADRGVPVEGHPSIQFRNGMLRIRANSNSIWIEQPLPIRVPSAYVSALKHPRVRETRQKNKKKCWLSSAHNLFILLKVHFVRWRMLRVVRSLFSNPFSTIANIIK